ncbi:unnamed protein product, partial [Durusdinium trenchii]
LIPSHSYISALLMVWKHLTLAFCLFAGVAGDLIPGFYVISGFVSFWRYGGHLLIVSPKEGDPANSSVALFGFDRDEDTECWIPGCEWRILYRADVASTHVKYDRNSAVRYSLSLLLLSCTAAWYCGWRTLAFCLIGLVVSAAAMVQTPNEGTYFADIELVNPIGMEDIPGTPNKAGPARAIVEVSHLDE